MKKRTFDLILWGATGYTGKLVARYLLEIYGVENHFRWALGGRNKSKLEALRYALGEDAAGLPLVTGDALDPESMTGLARKARVVCTTVGPYAELGEPLVAACARQGTHYCDLTGEVPWIRAMIDAHEPDARNSGAHIVFCCGFDSIPSDLGVLFLQRQMTKETGEPCRSVRTRVTRLKGGISGGTAAGLLLQVKALRHSPDMRALLQHPYALNPAGALEGPDGYDQTGPVWDADLGMWTAPFIMATINTRVVRRTNALMDYAYGRDFSYTESMTTGSGGAGRMRAAMISLGLNMMAGLLAFRPTRYLAQKYFLPQPGQGPSQEERNAGHFEYVLAGTSSEGMVQTRCIVGADVDPGYAATSRMLAESAVCLVLNDSNNPMQGGMWTPASALGLPLVERLRENAGMRFSIHNE